MNGEGQLFTPADKAVYMAYMNVTEIHKEQVLKIENKNIKLQGVSGRQKESLTQIENIPNSSLVKVVD